MRFVSFEQDGAARWGLLTGTGAIRTARGALAARFPSLKAAIAAGALAETGDALANAPADARLEAVRLLPVIPDPGKIFCIGINYEDHRAETKRDPVANPTIFTRFADAQVGGGEPMVKPKVSDRFDYEGELAVVIGKGGRNITEADALAHVAGYACFNDGSVRDWQRHTSQFTPGKNFYRSGSFGPWLVSADEVPDPSRLRLTTRLNGEVMQQAPTSDMIFTIPRQIAYISTFTPLAPGDVIATGTPGGVGNARTPPVYMKPGDMVEVEITGVGLLVNTIVEQG